jgi:hypothetical protein
MTVLSFVIESFLCGSGLYGDSGPSQGFTLGGGVSWCFARRQAVGAVYGGVRLYPCVRPDSAQGGALQFAPPPHYSLLAPR